MNANLLIDAVVRQTMILIAQLSTTSGSRATLAHIANETFLTLVRELQAQGLAQKIIADMFGMALRTYHDKVRRLGESASSRGRTLWEAIFTFIQDQDGVLRAEILRRFSKDDPLTVRSVLSDLVESGLVRVAGRGDAAAYSALELDEAVDVATSSVEGMAPMMVWVAVHRLSPATRDQLRASLGISDEDLGQSLDDLTRNGLIRREERDGADVYTSESCIIPYDKPAGWQAAVFDHYQAMVTAISTKLQQVSSGAQRSDLIGGSTYGFDVWPGHPFESEVLGLLRSTREKASELRGRVDTYNEQNAQPEEARTRVLYYVGQAVIGNRAPEDGGESA